MAIPIAVIIMALPETPRWLCKTDQIDQARNVIRRVYGESESEEMVEEQIKEIMQAIELEKSGHFTWTTLFRRGDPLQTGYRVFLGCLILLMNQVWWHPCILNIG